MKNTKHLGTITKPMLAKAQEDKFCGICEGLYLVKAAGTALAYVAGLATGNASKGNGYAKGNNCDYC